MGDVDPTVDGRLTATYSLSFMEIGVSGADDLASGQKGYTLTPHVETGLPLYHGKLFLALSVKSTYASAQYMHTFFGIASQQTARSGLPQHDADKGFKDIGASLFLRHQITKTWSALGMFGYKKLIGDAGSSPITEEKHQFMVAYS